MDSLQKFGVKNRKFGVKGEKIRDENMKNMEYPRVLSSSIGVY